MSASSSRVSDHEQSRETDLGDGNDEDESPVQEIVKVDREWPRSRFSDYGDDEEPEAGGGPGFELEKCQRDVPEVADWRNREFLILSKASMTRPESADVEILSVVKARACYLKRMPKAPTMGFRPVRGS